MSFVCDARLGYVSRLSVPCYDYRQTKRASSPTDVTDYGTGLEANQR